MRGWALAAGAALSLWSAAGAEAATTTYWNLFNTEGENTHDAVFVTYATLSDMLNDENRAGEFAADGYSPFGANIVGTGSDGSMFWNLFNSEGENTHDAVFVTYATLSDMLNDENRVGEIAADGNSPFGANIVGTGSDGSMFWNLFNSEGESTHDAVFVTYATLWDMLNDENRVGEIAADGHTPFGANIVESGSDGATYWNLFNTEGENTFDAVFATYATLVDMLNDENRVAEFAADGYSPFGANIVGTGAFIVSSEMPEVPLPASGLMLLCGVALLGAGGRLAGRSGT